MNNFWNLFKRVGFAIAILFASQTVFAQNDLDKFLKAGVEDAEKLTEAYISPLIKGLGYGINNGWYNTAKAHKTLGFDLTVSATTVFVPAKDELFLFNNDDYNNIRLADGESNQLPTAFGPSESGADLIAYDEDGQEVSRFEAPGGTGLKEQIGFNAVPVPMAQLGIGIVKNTDLKVRYIPTIDFDEGEIKLFGIGVMHDVKQWIPGIKLMPFDLSVLFGYTSLTTSYDMSGNVEGSNQEAVFTAKSTTVQGIISKQVSVLTFYGALGYNSVNSDVMLNGKYVLDGGVGGEYTIENPIDINITDAGMRATAGFRLKLAILTLHADYTLTKYPMATVGVGFAVR